MFSASTSSISNGFIILVPSENYIFSSYLCQIRRCGLYANLLLVSVKIKLNITNIAVRASGTRVAPKQPTCVVCLCASFQTAVLCGFPMPDFLWSTSFRIFFPRVNGQRPNLLIAFHFCFLISSHRVILSYSLSVTLNLSFTNQIYVIAILPFRTIESSCLIATLLFPIRVLSSSLLLGLI